MWKAHPTTVEVFQALSEERSLWVQLLAFGETLTPDGSIMETAKAVGTIAGLTILLEDFELNLQQQWQEAAERKKQEEEESEY